MLGTYKELADRVFPMQDGWMSRTEFQLWVLLSSTNTKNTITINEGIQIEYWAWPLHWIAILEVLQFTWKVWGLRLFDPIANSLINLANWQATWLASWSTVTNDLKIQAVILTSRVKLENLSRGMMGSDRTDMTWQWISSASSTWLFGDISVDKAQQWILTEPGRTIPPEIVG